MLIAPDRTVHLPRGGLRLAGVPVALRLSSRQWHLLAMATILLVALVLRVRLLTDVPRYADEINEIVPAFDIARGRSFPLTSGPKHIGALFDYILAGAILVFGRSPDLPRYVMLLAGLATVLLTYGYARSLGGRTAGLVAAGLLTVSAPHVLLSSRVAWSASLTPLLCVGAAWALDRAVSRRQPACILLTGLLSGLALQAHPSVVALLPGLAVVVLLRGRYLLRRPELYAAGLLFVVAYANVLLYNWQSRSGTVGSVAQEYPNKVIGPAAYLGNLAGPLRGIVLALASEVDPIERPTPFQPRVLLAAGVCLVALIYAAWRASPLPLCVVLSAVTLLPLVHDEFDPLLKARYVMPLVPLVYVAVGVFGADLLSRPRTARGAVAGRVAVGAVGLAIGAGMLASLLRFESVALANDCTNAPQRAFVAELERQRLPGEWVLFDEGVVRQAERLGYLTLLELSAGKVGEATLARGGVRKALEDRTSFLTAVDDGKAAGLFERQGIPLLPQTLAPAHPARRPPGPDGKRGNGGIGLYRVSADGAALLAHDPRPGCGHLRVN